MISVHGCCHFVLQTLYWQCVGECRHCSNVWVALLGTLKQQHHSLCYITFQHISELQLSFEVKDIFRKNAVAVLFARSDCPDANGTAALHEGGQVCLLLCWVKSAALLVTVQQQLANGVQQVLWLEHVWLLLGLDPSETAILLDQLQCCA